MSQPYSVIRQILELEHVTCLVRASSYIFFFFLLVVIFAEQLLVLILHSMQRVIFSKSCCCCIAIKKICFRVISVSDKLHAIDIKFCHVQSRSYGSIVTSLMSGLLIPCVGLLLNAG